MLDICNDFGFFRADYETGDWLDINSRRQEMYQVPRICRNEKA
jgi:hypothetical protein